jgi:hypothetical protein
MQQSPKPTHASSQKQPAGAAPLQLATNELHPQSNGHEPAVSPGSQLAFPQMGPPHEPQDAHASGQQSPKPTHALSQKQPAGATVLHEPAPQPQS